MIKYLVALLIIVSTCNIAYTVEKKPAKKETTKQYEFISKKQNHWYIPDLVMVQTAGYIGFVVGGLGYTFFNEKLDTIASYGYVPENIGGRRIHTFAVKNSYYPARFNLYKKIDIIPFYSGLTALFSLDKDVYWELSTNAPAFYYPPTGAHLALNVGTKIIGQKGNAFFIELSMLDTYAKTYFWDDFRYVAFNECVTLAMGYIKYFEQ